MPSYLVEWTIDIEADTAEEAARAALAIHRDPDSIATVFQVRRGDSPAVTFDLGEIDAQREAGR